MDYEKKYNEALKQKQLLFKDLCARLPYGVKFPYHKEEDSNHRECDCVATLYSIDEDSVEFDYSDNGWEREWSCTLSEVKPYLRPMSSMTAEEENFYYSCLDEMDGYKQTFSVIYQDKALSLLDWLNEHHFDYRGLIEKGLALKAPEDMYKTN